MRYEGKYTQAISFPLGGIGTGSIGLAGNGMLIDWEIKNRPDKCSNNGFSFFAVKAEKDGKVIDARVLNGDLPTPYQGMPHVENFSGYGFGPFRCTMAGVPHFSKHCFDGSFPFAEISFEEDRFPGKAKLKAYNPMIPTNEYDSGIVRRKKAYVMTISKTSSHSRRRKNFFAFIRCSSPADSSLSWHAASARCSPRQSKSTRPVSAFSKIPPTP